MNPLRRANFGIINNNKYLKILKEEEKYVTLLSLIMKKFCKNNMSNPVNCV
jgi:hypothetical protein